MKKLACLIATFFALSSCKSRSRTGFLVKDVQHNQPESADTQLTMTDIAWLNSIVGRYNGKSDAGSSCFLQVSRESDKFVVLDEQNKVPIAIPQKHFLVAKTSGQISVNSGSATCPYSLTNGRKVNCEYKVNLSLADSEERKLQAFVLSGQGESDLSGREEGAMAKVPTFKIVSCRNLQISSL